LADWLGRATERVPLAAADGKSGAHLERVTVDGERYVVKHVRAEDDWIMRATGDDGSWFLRLWQAGTLASLPAVVDPVVVDVYPTAGGSAIVMHDVTGWLVPEGDAPVPVDQHERFVAHLARLHAAYWGWRDDLGLLGLDRRYVWFAPGPMRAEQARSTPAVVPGLAVEGWERLRSLAPDMAAVLVALHDDARPLVTALERTPRTLVHGDVKLGNLGSRPDGTTIMIDWALPGEAPCGYDLAHYLALNASRVPEAKEEIIVRYRRALEGAGVPTQGWFEDQAALCLLGHMMLLGWEKALQGPGPDLGWWRERVVDAASRL
jgi:aminoglycoside phosphotransferase (APT) family kinase protein